MAVLNLFENLKLSHVALGPQDVNMDAVETMPYDPTGGVFLQFLTGETVTIEEICGIVDGGD